MSYFTNDNVLVEIIANDNGTIKTFYIRAETDSTTSGGGKRINKLYIDTGTSGHPDSSSEYKDWIGLFEDTSITTSNNYLANPGLDVGFFYITSDDINQATDVNNENTLSDTSNNNRENITEIKIHYPYIIFDSNIVKPTNQYNVTIDFSPINNLGTENYTLLSAEGTTSTISLYEKNRLFDLSKSLLKDGTTTDIINFIGSGNLNNPVYNFGSSTATPTPVYELLSRVKKIIIIYKGGAGEGLEVSSESNLSFHNTTCIDLGLLNNNVANNLGVIGSNNDNIPLFLWEFSDPAASLVSDPVPNAVNSSTSQNFNYDFYPFSIFDNTGIRAKINENTQGTENKSISVGNPIIGRTNPGTTFNYNLSSTLDNYFNTNLDASTFDSNADDNLLEDNYEIQGVSVEEAYDDLKGSFSRVANEQDLIEVPTANSLEIKGGVVGSNAISCFVAEEVVETDQGLVKIKDITKKHSIRGMRVKYLSKITIKHSYIVKINKHALGENRPNKDTLCSPRHGIYLNDNDKRFVVLQKLINNNTITKVDINKNTDLYNILLEDNIHSYMYVNNLKVETLHPSNPSIPIISSKKI